MFLKKCVFVCLCVLTTNLSFSQVYTDKPVGKNKIEKDSIDEYKYALPLLGKKAHALGFDLPYSAGLSVNYLWQESGLVIENLTVGFNGSTPYDLDNIIRFNNATATTNALNVRPDFWVFPFLNVYGILASSKTSTAVDFSINVPNGDDYTEVMAMSTIAEFKGQTFGFGLTPTFGVAGGFIALDMNFSWTDIPELAKPSQIFVFGPRFGKSFNLKSPEGSIAFWVGGFRVKMKSETAGTLPLNSLFDTAELGGKIEGGYARLDEAQNKLDTWWNGLTPKQQERRKDTYDREMRLLQKPAV